MRKRQAYAERRIGEHDLGQRDDAVNLNAATLLIRSLDSAERTLVCFTRNDDWVLMVAGGPTKGVVSLVDPNGVSSTLAGEFDGPRIDLCCGGQWADFDAKFVVSLEMAETAMDLFTQNAESTLVWHQD